MSHEVETMAYAGNVPWHGLGVRVNDDLTPQEILEAAGLNWTVSKRHVRAAQTPTSFAPVGKQVHVNEADYSLDVKEFMALVRDSDNKVLGVCGPKYIPCQNSEAFEFFSKFVKAGHMKMETAGSLKQGKIIWGLAKLNKAFQLAGKDEVEGYLLLGHPHEWGKSLFIQFTAIRVVCWNTYSAALTRQGQVFRMPHIYAFDENMMNIAETALGLGGQRLSEFEEQAKVLAHHKAKRSETIEFVTRLFQPEIYEAKAAEALKTLRKQGAVNDNVVQKLEISLDECRRTVGYVHDAIEQSPGSDLDAAKGTWWGAFNGVTYYLDHRYGKSNDSRLDNAWFGANAMKKRQALALAKEYALAA